MNCGRKLGPFDCCSVVQGDCLELMKQLPDGCFDAVITDPPYGTKVQPWDESIDASVVAKCLALSRGYSVFFYSNTRLWHLLPIIKTCGYDSWTAVWHKSNTVGFERRFAPQWTPIVIAYKGNPPFWGKDLCFCPIQVQDFAHPTPKQLGVMEWCVEHASREGDLLLDPFLGSGTTAVAAAKLGRHFLGFEISPEYCRIARERIAAVEAQPTLFQPSAAEQLTLQ